MSDKPASRFPLLFALLCSVIAVVAGLLIFQPWDDPDTLQENPGQVVEVVPSESSPPSNPNPDLSISEGGLSQANAIMITNKGKIVFKFFPEDAPNTVNHIINLIHRGFYNGLTFHRVVPNFIAQTGDPTGKGFGGSGKTIPAEFNSRPHMDGAVGLAHGRDPDSGDSQFYFSIGQQASLNGRYTVFGMVTEGMEVVRQLEKDDVVRWLYIE